jgi:hypothetical protein
MLVSFIVIFEASSEVRSMASSFFITYDKGVTVSVPLASNRIIYFRGQKQKITYSPDKIAVRAKMM